MKETSQPVFLVEDNEVYLKTLEKHLRGHISSRTPIKTFLTGEDCLQNMDKNPKIVVLDYFLNTASANAMNGLEVLKKIKAEKPDTMVLMLSSQDNLQVATDTMRYGAFDYVSKNENAFVRVQNAINNIEKIISQDEAIKAGKQVKMVLIAWIVFLVATIVTLQLFFPELLRRTF